MVLLPEPILVRSPASEVVEVGDVFIPTPPDEVFEAVSVGLYGPLRSVVFTLCKVEVYCSVRFMGFEVLGSSIVISANLCQPGKPSRSPNATLLFRRKSCSNRGGMDCRSGVNGMIRYSSSVAIMVNRSLSTMLSRITRLYDETMHAPLVFATPKTRGIRHKEHVQLPDIVPTITDILGVDSPLGAFGC